MIKLTGLWKQTGKDGEAYYSGKLGYSATLLIFKNKYKKKDSDPDLMAYVGEAKKTAPAEENGGAEVEPF